MDPPEKLKLKTDSSFALIKEGLKRNHHIKYIIDKDLSVKNGTPYAYAYDPLIKNEHELKLTNKEKIELQDFDALILRKDPPFNMDYIYMTYLIEMVGDKVLCVNRPSSLRTVNEKFYAQHFAFATPPSLISKDVAEIKSFLKEFKKGIIKPLDLNGGQGIEIIEHNSEDEEKIKKLSKNGTEYILAQEFLKGVLSKGDKRILVLDGKPLNALLRIPKKGDFKGNISAGATTSATDISKREQEICSKLEDFFKSKGLHLVGLDFIDEKLTEINVTSPIISLEAYSENAKKIYDFIESKIS